MLRTHSPVLSAVFRTMRMRSLIGIIQFGRKAPEWGSVAGELLSNVPTLRVLFLVSHPRQEDKTPQQKGFQEARASSKGGAFGGAPSKEYRGNTVFAEPD